MSKNKKLAASKRAFVLKNHFLRTLDRDVANSKESSLRRRANRQRMTERLRSGKSYSPPRRDPLADRDIFIEIQRSLKARFTVRLSCRRDAGVIHRRYPLYTWKKVEKEDRSRRRRKIREKVIWVPHYDHTGDRLKAFAMAMVLKECGADAFTLHLSPDVISSARASSRGFARYIQDRITRELRKAMKGTGFPCPNFLFMVEASDLGTPHLHGAILIDDDPGASKKTRIALKRAGGHFSIGTGRELDIRDMYDPAGWMEYISKWGLGSELKLKGSTFGATNELRACARDWYEEARLKELPIVPVKDDDYDLIDLDIF